MDRTRRTSPWAAAAVAVAAVLALGACGPTSADDSSASPAPSSPVPGVAGAQPGGGAMGEQFQGIQQCLEAAGIEVGEMGAPGRAPGGLPTDGSLPSGLPSGFPTDGSLPSGLPSGFPTDGSLPSPRPGGGFSQSPEVKAALDACGLSLPAGPGGTDPSAAPTAG